jgi:nicotinamidase-related amidase
VAASRLLDRQQSCLVVIDVQNVFLKKLPHADIWPLTERIIWMAVVANALEVPILATAEDIKRNGPLVSEVDELLEELPSWRRPVFDKLVFGLYDQKDIRDAVKAVSRSQFVLVGLETDVCVTHSAFGLLSAGHDVTVVADACASPAPHHEMALARLRDAGVTITTAKGVYYEWVRDLATLAKVKSQVGGKLPPDMTL